MTGASGFVATQALISLLQHGYSVRGTIRSESTAQKVLSTHSHLLKHETNSPAIVPDVAAPHAFTNSVKDVNRVIHTASPFAIYVEDNQCDLLDPAVKETTELLTAARDHALQVRRVVIASSFATILDLTQGTRPGYNYSEKDWNPVTPEAARTGGGAMAYCVSKNLRQARSLGFRLSQEWQRPETETETKLQNCDSLPAYSVRAFGPQCPSRSS